jgi:HSP20 family protein
VLHVFSLRLFAVEQLRDEVRRLFEDFERSGAFAASTGWFPSVDVCENETSFVVRIELPGIEPDMVNVSLAGSYLKIEGTKPHEEVDGTTNRLCLERSSGPFCRVVRLSPDVDSDSVSAGMRDGVLSITVPKLLEPIKRERRIPISLEGEQ